jgi:stearoyl-CoA desaturase (delta-9 desaturase)
MNYLAASSNTVSLIQLTSIILSVFGFFYFEISLTNFLLILFGYFLYSGIGISMTMHRYWSHRSFEFRSNILKWICTFFAIIAGRGSPIGWVYVHRMHHRFSDTLKDPHDPETVGWKIFFPNLIKYGKDIDRKMIKDLFNKEQLYINRYYLSFILIWSFLLISIDIKLFYFFYVIPVSLTFIGLDLFVLLTHKYGYRNFNTKDNSKNNWFISLILWGEGWHNNHHNNSHKYSTKEKWWEIDLLGTIINIIKK